MRFLTKIRGPIYRNLNVNQIGDFKIGDFVYERPRYRQNDYDIRPFVQNGCNKGEILGFVLRKINNQIFIKVPCPPFYDYGKNLHTTMLFPIEYATKDINDLNTILDDHNCYRTQY